MIKKPARSRLLLAAVLISFALVCFPSPGVIYIKTHLGDLKKENPSGGFKIDAVAGDCDVSAKGGGVEIGIIEGNLVAKTTRGDISVAEVTGNAELFTGGGNITIQRARAAIHAETLLGDISIYSAENVFIENSYGGDVNVFNVTGYAKVHTIGNILLRSDVTSRLADICDLSSTIGDVVIEIPETIGALVEVITPITKDPRRDTQIQSDFSFTHFKQGLIDEGTKLKISAQINDGGGKIRIYIAKGNIYLKIIRKEK